MFWSITLSEFMALYRRWLASHGVYPKAKSDDGGKLANLFEAKRQERKAKLMEQGHKVL